MKSDIRVGRGVQDSPQKRGTSLMDVPLWRTPSRQKSFTFRSKNNNKPRRNVIFYWQLGVPHKFILL